MKNLGDRIDVAHGVREDDGTKLEPEQQPVRRTIATEAEATHGDNVAGGMTAAVTIDMDAAEAVDVLAHTCQRCANWRPEEWPSVRRQLAATKEGQDTLDRVRAQILGLVEIDEDDLTQGSTIVEHVMATFGLCGALTEIESAISKVYAPIITFPTATCPSNDSAGRPLPPCFTPRAAEQRREVNAVRDSILSAAQGRGFRR